MPRYPWRYLIFSGTGQLGLVLAVIATAQLMVVLDLTIVVVALPHIQAALSFSGSDLEWVVNAYAVAFGGLLLGGRAGDLQGRRRILVAGVLVFSLAPLLGGLAAGQAWLIAARAVQGAGAAMAAPTALSLVDVAFPEGRPRNRAVAVYSAMAIVGVVAGLIAGGPAGHLRQLAVVLFVNVPIVLVVASLAAAAVLLGAFGVIEARSSYPLPPVWVLRSRDRSGAYLISLCTGTGLVGMFFFLTLFVQDVWGYSALRTAAAYLPFVPAVLVMTAVAQQGVSRVGARPLLIAGSAIAAGGMVWLSRLTEHSTFAGAMLAGSWSSGPAWACCSCPYPWSG
jgi:MFS family permease